jgi:hypothetical protein
MIIFSKGAVTVLIPKSSYDQFQISEGVAGTAEAEANAVFVDPFPADLATVDKTSLVRAYLIFVGQVLIFPQDNLGTMREAAEAAEVDQFNPAIAAASGAEGVLPPA